MAYKKFTADNIFTGYEMLSGDSVLITDEKGTVLDIANRKDAGGDIQELNGILTPGFVNCHCHLELSHLKGLVPKGTGMVQFLLTVMGNRDHPSAEMLGAIAAAEESMVHSGIVAAGDICNTDNTVLQKQQRSIHYHNFIEAAGFSEDIAGLRFGLALELYEKFGADASIAPHAPYSVSGNLFDLINKHEPGSLLTIHNQESHAENELFQRGTGDFLKLYSKAGIDISDFKITGKTSIQSYLNKITRDHSLLLVHNTVTDQADLDWVFYNKTFLPELFWCICPNANLYINNRIADISLLVRAGCKMVVGTDSLASNDQLNMLEELKTLLERFSFLTLTELLKWATVNGARALRIADRYGSFERGKKPGLVLVENVSDGSLTGASSRKIL